MGKQVRHSIFGRHLIYKKKGGRGKHGRAQVFHLVRSPHHHHLGEGRDAVALQQPNILVGENRSPNDATSQCEARGLWHLSDDHHQLLWHGIVLGIALYQKKDDLVHTNANPISPFCAEESLLQSGPVQLHLLLFHDRLLLLLLLLLQHLLLLWQRLCSLFFLPILPLGTLYCYSCYLNKAMLTTKNPVGLL